MDLVSNAIILRAWSPVADRQKVSALPSSRKAGLRAGRSKASSPDPALAGSNLVTEVVFR